MPQNLQLIIQSTFTFCPHISLNFAFLVREKYLENDFDNFKLEKDSENTRMFIFPRSKDIALLFSIYMYFGVKINT